MSLGFDITPLCRPVSGVGRYTYNIIVAYAKEYPETKIYLLGFLGDKINSEYSLDHPNIYLELIPMPRKAYQFLYRKFYRINCDRWIKKLNLDLLVCPNFTIFPYTKSVPSTVIIHDLAFVRYPEAIEEKNLAYLKKHVPLSLQEASRIGTVSEFGRDELYELYGIDKNKVSVISPSIDSSPAPKELPKGRFVLTVATLEPRKNLDRLTKAYSKLPEKTRSNYPLKIVGADGWGKVQANKEPGIEFLGYVTDQKLQQLYQTCALFVFPSVYEGFGLPILESYRFNTPVVCSDIPPFRKIAGDTATYFNPIDISSITTAINNALAKPKRSKNLFKIAQSYDRKRAAYELDQAIKKFTDTT